ncbi:MAG: hypothetical protein MJ171_06960 [Clostridia bacterium]|nr:hypothetical protein [Clostridia bacterium]
MIIMTVLFLMLVTGFVRLIFRMGFGIIKVMLSIGLIPFIILGCMILGLIKLAVPLLVIFAVVMLWLNDDRERA